MNRDQHREQNAQDTETKTAHSRGEEQVGERSPIHRLQRGVGNQAVQQVIEADDGGGRQLTPSNRQFLEGRFGRGLRDVRVHDGERGRAITDSLDAAGVAYGRNVYLGNEYQPETVSGTRLLAHEVAHVLQQNGSVSTRQSGSSPAIPDPGHPLERDATTAADSVLAGEQVSPLRSASEPIIARQSDPGGGSAHRIVELYTEGRSVEWLADELFDMVRRGDNWEAERAMRQLAGVMADEDIEGLRQTLIPRLFSNQIDATDLSDIGHQMRPGTLIRRVVAMDNQTRVQLVLDTTRGGFALDDPAPDTPVETPSSESPPSRDARAGQSRASGARTESVGDGPSGGGDGGDGPRRRRFTVADPPGRTVVDYESQMSSGQSRIQTPYDVALEESESTSSSEADEGRQTRRRRRPEDVIEEREREQRRRQRQNRSSSSTSESAAADTESRSGRSLIEQQSSTVESGGSSSSRSLGDRARSVGRKADDLLRRFGWIGTVVDLGLTVGPDLYAHATTEDLESPPGPMSVSIGPELGRDEIISRYLERAARTAARTRYNMLVQVLPGQGSLVGDLLDAAASSIPIHGGAANPASVEFHYRLVQERRRSVERTIEDIEAHVSLTDAERQAVRSAIEGVYDRIIEQVRVATGG